MDQLARLQAALTGRYTIEHELGRGGMATVYLAQDLKHGRPIALKVLRPELAAALGPGRFLREIEIAARLTHPNILPLHDSGDAGGLLYYVMPYVDGESLRSRLAREGPLPLDQALEIAREVASALGYAHEHGVVHRDIKPENVLLESGHAVVADFGVARAVWELAGDRLTETGIAVGSPAYMSPEQAGAEERLDGRSDIYALGCVLYEMLVGEPPFTGPTPRAVAAKHLRQSVPSARITRPGVPAAVDRVIRTALAKVPADRFSDAAHFAAALAACAGQPGRRLAPRRWTGVVVAAALTVAVGRWAWARWSGSPSLPVPAARLDPTHVAVLYFEDLSEGRTLRHVAGGLTEDLIDQLGQVDALRVISSSGVAAYRERSVPLDSIARTLGVGTIVTGSVGRSADRLRVAVRLIDAANGNQLRSQTLERPWGDLFVLRDAVAQQVSRFLREELGQEVQLRQRRAATGSVAAWELVQRAQRQWDDARALRVSGDEGGADALLATGDSLLARAEAYDPAWVEPVLLRGWLAAERASLLGVGSGAPRPFWIRVGLEHAERALARRPAYPPALELQGTLLAKQWLLTQAGGGAGAVDAAERDLRAAAVPANPSQGRAWSALSQLLQARGKVAEANLAAERAYRADAFLRDAAEIVYRLYYTSSDLDRQADALRWCSEGRARFPGDWRFAYCQLAMLLWPGGERPDVDRAWGLVADLERLSTPADRAAYTPRWHLLVAGVLARAGRPDSARAVIGRSRAAAPNDPEMDYNEAVARTLLGERARALSLLGSYLKAMPQVRDYLGADPAFRGLRDDPRFQALIRPL